MKAKPQVCLELEADLVAVATGDAEPGAARRVEHHVDACAPCRAERRGHAEIGDHGVSPHEQDVLRLDVAVYDAKAVGVAEAIGHFLHDPKGLSDG